jgi:hypothetical protein
MPKVLRKGDVLLAPNWKLGADIRRTHNFDPTLAPYIAEIELVARELAVRDAFGAGDYFGSIHGEITTTVKGQHVGLVAADDFKANWLERGHRIVTHDGRMVGTVKGKRILRRAARRAGLRYRPPRKRAEPST